MAISSESSAAVDGYEIPVHSWDIVLHSKGERITYFRKKWQAHGSSHGMLMPTCELGVATFYAKNNFRSANSLNS